MAAQDNKPRIALVTGASRGLGKAIALKLAESGAHIAVNYISRETEAKEVADAIAAKGSEALLVKADIRDSEQVKNMVKQVTDKWDRIDILVNNAGITKDGLILRMPDETWDSVISTNLRGAFLCSKFALRSMASQGWGRIINIASLAGVLGNPGQTNYAASKGGLIAFTKSLAKELGSRNITVNAIAPGFISTDMTDKLTDEQKKAIFAMVPLQRFGTAQDVADLAAFLASDRAGYITGQVINIDGGIS
jgi:3-oxoacyl-[acyl-carrier protein] reductase